MLLDNDNNFLETLQRFRTNIHNVALRLSEDARNHGFCEKLRAEVNENINPAITNALNRKFDAAEDLADSALTNLYSLYQRILGRDEEGKKLPRGRVIVIYPPKNIVPLPGASLTPEQRAQAVEHFKDSIFDAASEILSCDGALTEFTKVHMACRQGDLPSPADSLHHTKVLIRALELTCISIEGPKENGAFVKALRKVRSDLRKAIGDDFESLVAAAEEGREGVEIDDEAANKTLDRNFTYLHNLINGGAPASLRPLRPSEEATAVIPGSLAHIKESLKKAAEQLEDERGYEFPDYSRAVNRGHGR